MMKVVAAPILIAAGFVVSTQVADLVFTTPTECTGEALYGGWDYTASRCVDLSDYEGALSVLVARLEPAQEVTFYSDAACQEAIHSTSQATCYTAPHGAIASFLISTIEPTTKVLVVASDAKLSNYTDLANRDLYEVIDLVRSLGLVAIGIGIAAIAASVPVATAYVVIGSCIGTGGDPLPVSYCVIGGYATIMTIALPIIYAKYGEEILRNVRLPGNLRSGSARLARRELLDSANHEYMLHLMNISSLHGSHVGSMERENQHGDMSRSPLFEIGIGNATWHMAAFMDPESGEFTHHIHHPSQTELAERSKSLNTRGPPSKAGWKAITWTNKNFGVDYGVCSYGGSYNGWDTTADAKNYTQMYDQISCSESLTALEQAKEASIDVQDKAGTVIGTVEIQFTKGSKSYSAPKCARRAHPAKASCAVSKGRC